MLGLGEVAQHIPKLVVAAALHRRPHAEDQVDPLAERQRAVDHEQSASLRVQAAAGQVFEQRLGHLGVLGRPFPEAQEVLLPLVIDPRRADHVVRAELDAVDPDVFCFRRNGKNGPLE